MIRKRNRSHPLSFQMCKSDWRTWGSLHYVSTTPWPATLLLAPNRFSHYADLESASHTRSPFRRSVSSVHFRCALRTNELSILIDLALTRHHPPILTPQSHQSALFLVFTYSCLLNHRGTARSPRFQDNVIAISIYFRSR